ncbi:hypothetical protein [Thiohalorhabdus methylotrophus]|uniref:Cupin domain-containing protein n=1 Tax=Thiohalorhabdus methylotrophus TaxID=3242694 RepID=A0ABV4TY61_9GAMM
MGTAPNPPDVIARRLCDDGIYPNNPALPLLVYRSAFAAGDPDGIERVFATNGWPPAWRFGVFGYHHYHGTAHEVLGCFTGSARIQFGGPEGPALEAEAGDVVILPAGTAHKCLEARDGFRCVGAYPTGQDPDMNTGRPGEHEAALERIAGVPVPAADPAYGEGGPMRSQWMMEGGRS